MAPRRNRWCQVTTSETERKALTLFGRILDVSAADRLTWLETNCTDNRVKRRVIRLLERHDGTGMLDSPVVVRDEPADVQTRGKRVGPWIIESRIGAGGMGVVYRATRADGLYQRTVALKLLAPNVAAATGEQLARRMDAERRILARLEHDGIARLYDGGVTSDSMPWLALEFVEGRPITEYCRSDGLPTSARLSLFLRACDAVAYAHRSLVIHRDIKPAHIVVTTDAVGRPGVKLLDFGVAALLEEGDSGGAVGAGITLPHALTPAYAAPEQVRPGLGAISTATDVYALGVVLYELLADRRPYELAGKSAAEVETIIIDTDVPRPSTVARPDSARTLRGDLDTIVLKALAKDPGRRYASAAALADDLRRYLAGDPVEARPATTTYRLRKFIAKHRVGVAVAVAFLLLVSALTGIYTVRLGVALDHAQSEATRAAEVNEFLLSMLSSVDPFSDEPDVKPESLTVAFVLREAASSVDAELADQPEILASVHRTIGVTFHRLGLFAEADPHLNRALEMRLAIRPDELHPSVLQSMEDLASLAYDVDNIVLFDSLQDRVVTLHREQYGELSLEYAGALARRAATLPSAEADPMFVRALRVIDEAGDGRSMEAFEVLSAFALQRHTVGDWVGADSLYAQAVALGPAVGLANHPTLAATMSSWAALSWFLAKPDATARLVAEALAIQETRLPDDHPNLAQTRSMVAGMMIEAGRFEEAEAILRHTKSVFEEQLPLWWAKDIAGAELAAALLGQRRDEEGEALMRYHLPRMRAQAGDGHGWTRHAIRHYVDYLDARGRSAEADTLRHLTGF